MNNGMEEFASLFKDRENPDLPDWTTGKVVQTSPLKIRVNENILLEQRKLVIPERLNGSFVKGDMVVLFPSQDYKRVYVADKVVM
ncbi:DUF2577 family protein [Salimicrobium halophilum]|uniref:Uncharacterized protein n=1 Tax=Salimicrobium halophilum TaxID=86666 RepID=A0A1G8WDE4_9BACI|nr:DUF2577 family protein [Salimicrobium halophilum]SDJ76147.1 Protein of unknown function [Salimicrobium halophilum]